MASSSSFDSSSISIETTIRIPATFVVLQGVPGDGMRNTMDRLPSLVAPEETTTSPVRTSSMPLGGGGIFSPLPTAYHVTTPLVGQQSPHQAVITPSQASSCDDVDSFIVVSEHGGSPVARDRGEEEGDTDEEQEGECVCQEEEIEDGLLQALDQWNEECRQYEAMHRREWREAVHGQRAVQEENLWWLSQNGELAVFDTLPDGSTEDAQRIPFMSGTIAPGTTVIGSSLTTLNSETLMPIPVGSTESECGDTIYPPGRPGWIQMLKIESPRTGYVALSADGYMHLAIGLPDAFCDPTVWMWRVTCHVGAFVREGLDLSTSKIGTIPYGSLCCVKRKTVNAMGLSRLHVEGVVVKDDGSYESAEGWCSEFLNPLSGQRGSIVQALPFPVPALYKVVLGDGAVIRGGVELSSPQIGHAPAGTILRITGRAFSEHPTDKCIERLRLAGNGGWISCRLNKSPPDDKLVVEFVGIDSTFEPNRPGVYHLHALKRVQHEQSVQQRAARRSLSPEVSSVDESAEDASLSSQQGCVYSATSTTTFTAEEKKDDRCLVCLSESRTATLVHGETGHIACCLVCARVLKARQDPCPVCRLPIDLVIQHFWA